MSEHRLQSNCVVWFRYTFPKYGKLLFAIPNGGQRNVQVAAKLKKEGVVPGVADLFLAVSRQGYNGLFIEMKFGKNKQSENQKEFQSEVELHGYLYQVCYTLNEFEALIINYLS